jgi:hypothetical protein
VPFERDPDAQPDAPDDSTDLSAGYAAMADNGEREREAEAWSEALIGDAAESDDATFAWEAARLPLASLASATLRQGAGSTIYSGMAFDPMSPPDN